MAHAREDEPSRQDLNDAGARKAVERQRLAEALRANLSRRKAQSRDRRARETSQNDIAESDAAAVQK